MIQAARGEWEGDTRELFLAPMSGVSELPYRLLALECGADVTITEFTSSAALTREVARSWSRMESHPSEKPFIPQIFGGDPSEMRLAASMLNDRADIIDLNFGCPAPKVTKICAGAALMGQPEDLVSMTRSIIQEVDCPVTAKMRLGTGNKFNNAIEISKELENIGVARLCVHGRTLKQRYSGEADWNYIQNVVESVEIPVIANGDIIDSSSAAACLETTSAAGLMIGRGAIGRPTVFGEIKSELGWIDEESLPWVDHNWYNLSEIGKTFASRKWAWDRYLELAKGTTGLRPKWLKRHATAFTKGLPGAKAARVKMHETETSDQFAMSISQFLAQKVDSQSSKS
ncbi:MAG: tRNA-dihydrouridine synthase family protein [Candidatus Poseidoniaceae archaeon]|jgi:tRNA-dihydrouridine synthase B|nr:tRNA-dihydrouridine synthase family protein [Candidatus Poseidoniaceae archaeon]